MEFVEKNKKLLIVVGAVAAVVVVGKIANDRNGWFDAMYKRDPIVAGSRMAKSDDVQCDYLVKQARNFGVVSNSGPFVTGQCNTKPLCDALREYKDRTGGDISRDYERFCT